MATASVDLSLTEKEQEYLVEYIDNWKTMLSEDARSEFRASISLSLVSDLRVNNEVQDAQGQLGRT